MGLPAGWLAGTVVRIGITGLARAGKTAFLTAVAANLLALGGGRPVLPALATRLGGRGLRVRIADAGAAGLARFDVAAHLASLAADPPRWPDRTAATSLLALDLELERHGLAGMLPPRRLRLEFLDYPGEWLLDLPLLAQPFAAWSARALRRLEAPELAAAAAGFLGFLRALPAGAPADEALAAAGHRLYRDLLRGLSATHGLSLLQPGRFVMPAPGPPPPWLEFFPSQGTGGLAALLAGRFDAYVQAVRAELASPMFGELDRLVVLADLLSPLHAGPAAFADARAALAEAAAALRWSGEGVVGIAAEMLHRLGLGRLGLGRLAIRRVALAATKADHVGERQRGNLVALLRDLFRVPAGGRVASAAFAIAAVRCTEDFVWTLDGHPVSAVRGRLVGGTSLTRSYPGEVPDRAPDAAFWAHRFLAVPTFEPVRPPEGGRGGVANIGLDALLAFLLDDLL